MLSIRVIMLDTAAAVKHDPYMLSSIHKHERLTCGYIAGEAFSYVGGDRLAVRTRGVHPRNVSSNLAPCTIVVSGTATAETVTAPDHQPRDLAPKKMTASRNIAQNRSVFQNAGRFPQMSDLARHEYPPSRQAN